jgi:ABC-2 type transport system ATP-binding protein
VDALSFSVAPGEILGIVGPNGAGKTSALRAMAGILRPSAGSIRVDGHDVEREPVAAKRALAFIPDDPAPFEMLTVLEHLRFTALAYGLGDAEARIQPLLEEMDLWEKRDALGSTLSRGMRQKLAFACAFLRNPAVLLLDEPLTGLDPYAIRDVRDRIRAQADAGTAVLVSSHLLDVVERLCTRVLILGRGRRLALGTLEEIRATAAATGNATLEDVFFAITGPGTPPRA